MKWKNTKILPTSQFHFSMGKKRVDLGAEDGCVDECSI